eukprot:gnl/TRDRNA2_/TRDRNA2_199094_c0_seq1.p2 gnl/TRDRNA2_/TRDRNA2_199094_c0~~gnl/TRDRNA2_/TRDRNA2_199094_c0_seq1.p2  ORF type:complete len:167 (-),score=44.59 gnl/TRDRNA2_/TRDRNA2_199094_c0_seq1:690-1124(-)
MGAAGMGAGGMGAVGMGMGGVGMGMGAGFGKATGKGADPRFSPYGMSAHPGDNIVPGAGGNSKMGRVKVWHENKGMGFITPLDGSEDLFVHRTAISDGGALQPGSEVMFETGWNMAKNKPIVTKCSGGVPQPGKGGGLGMMGGP